MVIECLHRDSPRGRVGPFFNFSGFCGILPKGCFGTIWLDRLVGGYLRLVACVHAAEQNLSMIEAVAPLPQEEIEDVDGRGLFLLVLLCLWAVTMCSVMAFETPFPWGTVGSWVGLGGWKRVAVSGLLKNTIKRGADLAVFGAVGRY